MRDRVRSEIKRISDRTDTMEGSGVVNLIREIESSDKESALCTVIRSRSTAVQKRRHL